MRQVRVEEEEDDPAEAAGDGAEEAGEKGVCAEAETEDDDAEEAGENAGCAEEEAEDDDASAILGSEEGDGAG